MAITLIPQSLTGSGGDRHLCPAGAADAQSVGRGSVNKTRMRRAWLGADRTAGERRRRTHSPSPSHSTRRRVVLCAAAFSVLGALVCGPCDLGVGDAGAAPNPPQAPSLTGTWTSSDGKTKIFGADGSCEGAYYAGGKPLDIGGPMTCQLSSQPDSSGKYQLMVRQGPNSAIYVIEFHGSSEASVSTKSGQPLYTITKF